MIFTGANIILSIISITGLVIGIIGGIKIRKAQKKNNKSDFRVVHFLAHFPKEQIFSVEQKPKNVKSKKQIPNTPLSQAILSYSEQSIN